MALGIVTTVAVAWACAGLTPRYGAPDVFGFPLAIWWAPGMRYAIGDPREGAGVLARARTETDVAESDWSTSDPLMVIDSRGWPWPALYHRFVLAEDGSATPGLVRRVLIPPLADFGAAKVTVTVASIDQWLVPLRIEWIGFGLDVVVFTMLWAGLAATRRPLRAACAPMTWRGRAGLVLLAGALGFVTTVAVAQVAATRPPPVRIADELVDGGSAEDWIVGYSMAPGRSRCWARRWTHGVPPGVFRSWAEALPYWAHAVRPPISDETARAESGNRVTIATGWPMRALSASAWQDTSADGIVTAHQTGIELSPAFAAPGPGPVLYWDFRALPTRPIWRGLIVDTLAFGLLWLIGIAWVVRIRTIPARRRVRSGRCGVCGYDRRGAPTCSECGADAAAVAARWRI
ncbi:MAG: hypothetical protein KDA25_09205 [Phycisphaerales bacterium]|nr:hypothetical protein [Phycisphaerales bacterium]